MVLNSVNGHKVIGLRARIILLLGVVLCLFQLFVLPPFVDAGESVSEEHLVKAAFVYNFFKFIKWPSKEPTLVLGVAGDGPMADALESLDNKRVFTTTILVKRVKDPRALKGYRAIFVTSYWKGNMERLLDDCKRRGILTIGDKEGFVEKGGMIGLFRSGDRVMFSVNLREAKDANIFISSELLRLAKRVVR